MAVGAGSRSKLLKRAVLLSMPARRAVTDATSELHAHVEMLLNTDVFNRGEGLKF